MTIYVHFNIRTGRTSERLHNVASVQHEGLDSVKVTMLFSDAVRLFTEVSHVAVKPQTN